MIAIHILRKTVHSILDQLGWNYIHMDILQSISKPFRKYACFPNNFALYWLLSVYNTQSLLEKINVKRVISRVSLKGLMIYKQQLGMYVALTSHLDATSFWLPALQNIVFRNYGHREPNIQWYISERPSSSHVDYHQYLKIRQLKLEDN